ncbi:hypothetical protein CNR22_12085 [Sphingobacteriaceae bacterium]|nr:hypothetical protein CNR22_12085 [Sphingobacteriaceae bacterium]
MTGHEDHDIPLATATALTKKYRDANPPGVILAHAFSKDSITALLAQPNCVGLRAYYGIDASGAKELVLVGIDASDNDLYTGLLLDRSAKCPPNCSISNPLNT